MYEQISGNTLYLMFYAGVTVLSLIACCYLLFRRANAIAPDVAFVSTPAPVDGGVPGCLYSRPLMVYASHLSYLYRGYHDALFFKW